MSFSLPRFGVTRPVPAKLLAMAILGGGIIAAANLRREFFPETNPDAVRVTLPYPGATPQEIEESMARKVEDAVADLDEVDEIQTTIAEGGGGLVVKLRSGVSVEKGQDEVERAIDTLTDLPDDAEEIRVAEFEPQLPAIMLTLYGDVDEEILKRSIRQIADDLRTLPGMGDVVISGVREYEVRIDVSQAALLKHGISLPQVSDAVRAWMNDVPGGTARTSTGNVNVRTLGVAEQAEMIRQIVVKATGEGQSLRVGDIATVREDFVDDQVERRFNGKPGVSITVFKTGKQDAIDIAEMVRSYAAGRRSEAFEPRWKDRIAHTSREQAYQLGRNHSDPLPGQLQTHSELSRFIEGRLQLLTDNAIQGGALIFATIFLAMSLRTAWWVMTGLATAIAGTIMLMWAFDVTLNLLTMFGLLITLGMLEDDAIVVSENIQSKFDKGDAPLLAAIKGADQVFWPVIGTVSTTVVAFLPLMFVQGRIGDLLGALPWVVLFSLFVSVVETMTILPSHMAHSLEKRVRNQRPNPVSALLRKAEKWRDSVLVMWIIDRYAAFLRLSMEYRYVSTAIAIATLIVSLGMIAGGRVEFTFLPDSDSETIIAEVRMPIGTPLEATRGVVARIEQAAQALAEVKTISAMAGQHVNAETGLADAPASHVGQLFIELVPVETRSKESSLVIAEIRRALGRVDEAESIRFSEISGGPGGPDITVQVTGDDDERMLAAVDRVKSIMAEFNGVHDITDDNYDAQRELQIQLKPGAAALGFTVADVARQVRGTLFGLEPHVFSARREDIKVRVRLDESARRDLSTIDNMWVIKPEVRVQRSEVSPILPEAAVPLSEIADLTESRSFSTIRRIDRQRAITVTADTDPNVNPEQITRAMQPEIDRLRAENPTLGIKFAGRQEDLAEAFASLPLAFAAALALIYIILACLFSSFTQPLLIMLAIPFAIIGVVWGHFFMGYQLTFLSLIGFVALTGVVVNNSLILIEFYNHRRRDGLPLREALIAAGRDRLRPIVLTSITTFFGLMPLVFETSFQAKFLIPMAIAISYGLVSSTVLTLAVLPCFIVILNDLANVLHYLWHGLPREQTLRPTRPPLAMLVDGE
jgi:multidrug efflux pump subunit AcrB